VKSPKGWFDKHTAPKWIYEFWECLLRRALGLRKRNFSWFKHPQMMPITVTTKNVLDSLDRWEGFRPFNFFLKPMMVDDSSRVFLRLQGQVLGTDPNRFALAAPYESDPKKWIRSVCLNYADPNDKGEYRLTTKPDPDFRRGLIKTYEQLFDEYLYHSESKSLGPNGKPCEEKTRGFLSRMHITAGEIHRIGKESERKWEQGEDLESLDFEPIEYLAEKDENSTSKLAIAKNGLIRKLRAYGVRKASRNCGVSLKTLERLLAGKKVNAVVISTLKEFF
jgi:hypothetical protein